MNFLDPEIAGRGGGLPREGVVVKSSFPLSKVCFPWFGWVWFKKFVQKKVVIFGPYFGAQNDYTNFYCLGINFLIARDICYTELPGRNSFCHSGASNWCFCER